MIDLSCPATGLFRENAYVNGKSRAIQSFLRLGKIKQFNQWLLDQPQHKGWENLNKKSINELLKEQTRASNFVRFLSTLNPEIFIYSIDFNWKKRKNVPGLQMEATSSMDT